jgi:hypothetical protein
MLGPGLYSPSLWLARYERDNQSLTLSQRPLTYAV